MRNLPCLTLNLSAPESFSHPGGRGSSESLRIRFTILRRSCLLSIDSISFKADGLKKSLYFPTLLQVPHSVFEGHVRLSDAILKSREIFGVFR